MHNALKPHVWLHHDPSLISLKMKKEGSGRGQSSGRLCRRQSCRRQSEQSDLYFHSLCQRASLRAQRRPAPSRTQAIPRLLALPIDQVLAMTHQALAGVRSSVPLRCPEYWHSDESARRAARHIVDIDPTSFQDLHSDAGLCLAWPAGPWTQ